MKVLVCDPLAKEAIDKMSNAGLDVTDKGGISPDELLNIIGDYEGVIVRSATKITKEVIEKGSKLKVIGRGGVGLDNIDTAYAKEKGIAVVNTPGASSRSVAELAIGMMFALSRFIARGTVTMRDGLWEKKKYKGVELGGKTLSLFGIGNIGKETAKMALGLGMKVIAYDPFIKEVDIDVKLVDMDTALKEADYLSLHIPLDKEKGAVIKAAELSKMKKSAFLINCARGGVVDEADLLKALNDGTIAGAGIDVYEKEPTDNKDLVNHPNVACTPHIGASTKEGQFRVGLEIADKIIEGLK